MSSQYKFENHTKDMRQQSKVKLTDLLSRINEEKKNERNRNVALSVAAVSAVTFFYTFQQVRIIKVLNKSLLK